MVMDYFKRFIDRFRRAEEVQEEAEPPIPEIGEPPPQDIPELGDELPKDELPQLPLEAEIEQVVAGEGEVAEAEEAQAAEQYLAGLMEGDDDWLAQPSVDELMAGEQALADMDSRIEEVASSIIEPKEPEERLFPEDPGGLAISWGKATAAWTSGNTVTLDPCNSAGVDNGNANVTAYIVYPTDDTPSGVDIAEDDVLPYLPYGTNTGVLLDPQFVYNLLDGKEHKDTVNEGTLAQGDLIKRDGSSKWARFARSSTKYQVPQVNAAQTDLEFFYVRAH